MEKFYPTKAGLEYAALTAQGKIIEFTKGKFGDGIRSCLLYTSPSPRDCS